jgi:hypothetical protein
MKRASRIAILFILLTVVARAQLTLTGVVAYSADNTGLQSGIYWWDSLTGGVANVYLFTGTPGSPAPFLNSGNFTPASYNLTEGIHTIRFAVNYDHTAVGGPVGDYIGLNFYFDGDTFNNRISVVVPTSGSAPVTAIGSVNTYGNYGHLTGAGTALFTSGGFTAEVTALQMTEGTFDIVGYTSTGPSGDFNDLVGSFTFTVTAVPEPGTYAAVAGLGALGVAWLRRRRSAVARRVSGGTE